MKAIGYCRVSTDEQAENGVSLDAQATKITGWCEVHDVELVRIYSDDGISGKSMHNRDGLLEALRAASDLRSQGEDVVFVIYSLSRLSRSTRDTLHLADRFEKERIELASLSERIDTTTPSGKLFFTIMAALNQYKIDETRMQTLAAFDQKRRNGEALGNTPYGWCNDRPNRNKATDPPGKLVPNEQEQRALRMMLRLFTSGEQVSYGAIGRALDNAGLPPRRGKRWNRGTIQRIIAYYTTTDEGRALLATIPAEDDCEPVHFEHTRETATAGPHPVSTHALPASV